MLLEGGILVILRSQASLVNIVLSVSTRLKPSFLFCHQETVNKKKKRKENEREIFVIMIFQVNMNLGNTIYLVVRLSKFH